VKLASNENPLGPSPLAVQAIQDSLEGLHRYPNGSGHDLVARIADVHGVDPACIVIGSGSDDIIGLLTQAFLGVGTETVLPQPSFLMYEIGVLTNGGTPVGVPLKSLSMDLDAMVAAVTPRTRMVFLCNPNNPTGTIVHRNDFEGFIHSLPSDVVVVIDEAYMEFVRDPDYFSGVDYMDVNRPIVVLRTFSKAYGLAGLRIGYGIMPAVVADVLNRIRQPFNAGSLSQAGALAAIEDEAFLEKTVQMVHEGLDYLYEGLDALGVKYFPTQANFFLIDVQKDANTIFERLLRRGIIVRSMASYGYPEYIRVNVGLAEENARFLNALGAVMDNRSSISSGK
jgi:histidinol-phosphate aminotransferase